MHLVGLDIGFSRTRRSNSIAVYRDGELRVTNLNVDERDGALAQLEHVDVLAIDAPVVANGVLQEIARPIEQLFCRRPFQTRCKPGMSHVRGTGRTLREHGSMAAQLAMPATARLVRFPQAIPGHAIVEAFPNAFLGVCLEEDDYAARPKLIRGGKFDWLYDRWIERDLFAAAVDRAKLPHNVTRTCELEQDHDGRGALICLLTAAFAHIGNAVVIGEPQTGYFFLPPAELWSQWALDAITGSPLRAR